MYELNCNDIVTQPAINKSVKMRSLRCVNSVYESDYITCQSLDPVWVPDCKWVSDRKLVS